MLNIDALFKGRHFDREIIVLCVRWYLRYKLSFRDLVEMMAERGLSLAHTTIMRWIQRYIPEFERRWNRFVRPVGRSWRVDETGSVAKTIAEDGRTGINWIRSPLCGGIEKSGNEDRLSWDIASADLSNLPLPDHRHRFETCLCSSGGSDPAEAEPRSDQTLDAPMILLDNIIQILALPETRTAPRVRRLSSSPRPPLDRRGSCRP